jgi:hypothetical protein
MGYIFEKVRSAKARPLLKKFTFTKFTLPILVSTKGYKKVLMSSNSSGLFT